MTISKTNIIEKINTSYKDQESQYLIYTIINKYSASSIIIDKNDESIKIDMSKINNECLKELNKFIKTKENHIKYQEDREKEIQKLKSKMNDMDINDKIVVKEINNHNIDINDKVIKENNNYDDIDINNHLLENWKKYWKSDYKGAIDNITDEHVRKIKNFKFKNKRFNDILKNVIYSKCSNNKNETIIENGQYLDSLEYKVSNYSDMELDTEDIEYTEQIENTEDIHIDSDIDSNPESELHIDKSKLFGSDSELETSDAESDSASMCN